MAKVFEFCDQDVACRRLLSTVVSLALQDSLLPPYGSVRERNIRTEALSGLRFLFEHGDIFLELLDMDAEVFRRRLLERMYSAEVDVRFTGEQKRIFRWNYGQYVQLRSSEAPRS